jgi:tRNA 2-thiouridine synthesizing protein A
LTVVVDARGHRCPTPTLRLRRALETTAAGETVELLADDPLARIDIPHFCTASGHVLLDITAEDGIIRATVQRCG